MTDDLDGVRDHYRATGLTERLKTALMALGPQDARLTPEQLGALDQFHTRGLAATAELAKLPKPQIARQSREQHNARRNVIPTRHAQSGGRAHRRRCFRGAA